MKVRASAIIREEDCVLFLQYDYPRGAVYCIPGGGVHAGETVAQALVREFQEELSLDIKLGPLAYLGDMLASQYYPQTLHVVFQAEIVTGTPVLNPEFTTANRAVWLPVDEIQDKILYPSINQPLTRDLKAGNIQASYLGDCLRRKWL